MKSVEMALPSKMANVAVTVAFGKIKGEITGVKSEPPEQVIIHHDLIRHIYKIFKQITLAISRSMSSAWLKNAIVPVRMKINRDN